jgi:hypothetical protein
MWARDLRDQCRKAGIQYLVKQVSGYPNKRERLEGFDKLDEFGAIREIEKTDERLKAICDLHIAVLKEKQSSLIIAPTHDGEARRIAAAARNELRNQGLMEDAEHTPSRGSRKSI